MSLATSCDITRHHAIGSGSGSGAGGVRCHSSEGVAEERRGGGSGSGRQAGVGSGSGRRAGVGSVRGSPYSVITVQRRPAVVPATPTPRSGWAPRPRQLEVPATTIRTPIRSAGLMSATSKLSVGYESATISTVQGNVAEAGPSNHKPQVQDNMQVDEALARRLQKLFNEEAQFRQLDEAGSEDDVSSDDHPGSPMQEDSDGDEYVEGADNNGKGKAKGQAKRKGTGKEPAGVKERETGKGGAGAGDPKASGRVKNRAEAMDKIHKPPCECCVEKKSISRVDANGGACVPCKRRKTKCSLAPLHKPSIRRPRPAN